MGLKTTRPRLKAVDSRRLHPKKQANSIYHTPEYVVWRDAVYARAGRRCEWPGCGRREARMFADHIVELRDGGAPFDPANGQCLCGSHHSAKTGMARAERAGLPAPGPRRG